MELAPAHPLANEAEVDALLADLSRTDDSAEAASKAKLLKKLVLGEGDTLAKKDSYIAEVNGLEHVEAGVGSASRSARPAVFANLTAAIFCAAYFLWKFFHPIEGQSVVLWMSGLMALTNFSISLLLWKTAFPVSPVRMGHHGSEQ